MKTQLNTNLVSGIFSGTYGTIWEDVNDWIYTDDRGDIVEELQEKYLEAYNHKNFMKALEKCYNDKANDIVEYINDAIGFTFVKSIKFNGSYSPQYYNFSNDQLDFEITYNKSALLTLIGYVKSNDDFQQYLKDHYTSCDGFMSFTANNIPDLLKSLEGEDVERSLGAILLFFISRKADSEDFYNGIEGIVYEQFHGNDYYTPEITCTIKSNE